MAAVAVFWSKGYRDTAIADLERATGLNRSSLYTAFGTKQAIFSLAGKAPAPAAPAGRAWFLPAEAPQRSGSRHRLPSPATDSI